MQLRKLFYLLLILPILFLNVACSDDDNGTDPVPSINESEVAAKHIEDNITYKSMITSTDLNNYVLTKPNDVYIMDIRSAADFANGHIRGAVNVPLADIVTHYRNNNLESKEKVAMVCYSGQTAAFATAMLRLLGYSNVSDLLFGMCSWNAATSGSWNNNIGNAYASQFTTTPATKNAAGDLPELNTGKETGIDIIEARVLEILASADPFGAAKVSNATVFGSLDSYYIVNYWPADRYAWGHIPGAVNYTTDPSELNLSTSLNTLPTDKPVVVYCYTGQTSAHVAAYLRVLGYDGRTLLFGVNGMSYDTMPGTKFDAATHVKDFELVQ
jgi:rhodanese-related sulfurtransferase